MTAQNARIGALGRWAALVALLLACLPLHAQASAVTIELFGRAGCPHCARAEAFLNAYAASNPEVTLRKHDLLEDANARARLADLAREHGLVNVAVPTMLVGNRVVVGFDDARTTGARIVAMVQQQAVPSDWAEQGGTCRAEAGQGCAAPEEAQVPIFGTLNVHTLGLPLFTIAVGLLDGFNPCAMWVLLFLLSLLVNLHDRLRMALIAGVFVLVSGVVYFAFMAAWLNVFLVLGASRAVQRVLGILAVGVGAVHVKDCVAFRVGPSLSIPESAKPGLYARARAIINANSLPLALGSAVVLAGMVNVVELLCTAGLPVIYTQILAGLELPRWQHYGCLVLYTVAYMTDDAAMVAVAVITLSRRKLDERGGRVLKLVSGVVMVALGILMLFHPEALGFS